MEKILVSIFFSVVVTVTILDACNETDPSLILTQCCRDGRDGRDGVTIMGPRGPQGCKGEPGKNGTDGKQGPQGLQGKCDNSKLNSVIAELQMKTMLRKNLVGHWKMDEEIGNFVDDDSGYGNHATVAGGKITVTRGKYSRGRYFHSSGLLQVPNSSIMKFGTKSFSFTGWLKVENYTYPLTNFAVQQSIGCYYAPGRPFFTAGWDIGHGFRNGHTQVCIRDHNQNVARAYIKHDPDDHTSNLLGKWTHYAVVFDRSKKKIQLYINAKKQKDGLDISKITGSIDNDRPLTFGYLHGWKTQGKIDEYRLYNGALNSNQISMIYHDKNL